MLYPQNGDCIVATDSATSRQPMYSIVKSKAAYWLCFDQLGGHVELPWLMRMYDVIHKPEVHNLTRRRQRRPETQT